MTDAERALEELKAMAEGTMRSMRKIPLSRADALREELKATEGSMRKIPLRETTPGVHIDALFVHCRDCVAAGTKDKVAVVILDGEVLTVVCENHPEPKRICSVTIPVEERPL